MFLTCSSPLCHVVARSRTLPDSGGRGRALPAAGRAALRPRDPAAAPATGCSAALSGTRRQATTGHPDTHGQLPVPLPGGAVRASGLSKQELAPFGEGAPSSLQPRQPAEPWETKTRGPGTSLSPATAMATKGRVWSPPLCCSRTVGGKGGTRGDLGYTAGRARRRVNQEPVSTCRKMTAGIPRWRTAGSAGALSRPHRRVWVAQARGQQGLVRGAEKPQCWAAADPGPPAARRSARLGGPAVRRPPREARQSIPAAEGRAA